MKIRKKTPTKKKLGPRRVGLLSVNEIKKKKKKKLLTTKAGLFVSL